MDRLSRWLLGLAGWRISGGPPPLDKYVLVFYPHTSNWDFVLGILGAWALRLGADFLAKDTLFRPPFGWLFRALGGHPVHRGERENVVAEVARFIASRKRVVLALAPEGTRRWTDHWKSGFYFIALEARVPLVLAYLDASTRTLGLGPVVQLSGDREQDLEVIRKFYEDKRGVHPDQASTIALR
jgi:1-acyl-sn-glycerol-3-phosphate acyltransferase